MEEGVRLRPFLHNVIYHIDSHVPDSPPYMQSINPCTMSVSDTESIRG